MKVIFRADASIDIGTGHVMRCLVLADALAKNNADCQFICRDHDGNLIEFIRSRGYIVHTLNQEKVAVEANESQPGLAHQHWLGATQMQDVEACASILAGQNADWLIVDHYALDALWERALAPHFQMIMVIDDLADRPHVCNLLLDQTLGRDVEDYYQLVPAECHLLCGSQYSLLRPEFLSLRRYSLQRRKHPVLRELLITMGGVDKENATGQVLTALRTCPLPKECRINIVMGVTSPWVTEVRSLAKEMPRPTRVLVGVSDMAQLMADSDLAIGAAGATSWERCCLGLPSYMIVLAENQRKIAQELTKTGAARLIDFSTVKSQLRGEIKCLTSLTLSVMSSSAACVTDGLGVMRVTESLRNKVLYANQFTL